MPISRRALLEELAAASDADSGETTTVEAVASALDADRATIESQLQRLQACALARVESDGTARITRTGTEFLALDVDDIAIVDPE